VIKVEDHRELVSHPRFHSVVLVLSSPEKERELQDSLHARKLVAHTIQVGDDPVTHQHFRAVVVHDYKTGCQWCHVGHVWHFEADS